jgi:cobalt-zinc-cadmium efflux system outer membrane protein
VSCGERRRPLPGRSAEADAPRQAQVWLTMRRRAGTSFVAAVLVCLLAAVPALAGPARPPEPLGPPRPAGPQESFDDQLAGPGALTLEVVVQRALAANLSIDAARERWIAAQAAPARAHDLPDPRLRYGFDLLGFNSRNPFDGRLRVQYSQELPYAGTRDLRRDVAEWQADRKAFEIAGTEVDVAAAARRAYYELYFVQRASEIHNQHLSVVRQLSTAAEELYIAGRAPQENVLRSLVALTTLLAQITDVDSRIVATQAELNGLLHRPPGATLGDPQAPSNELAGLSLEHLLAVAQQRNPRLAAVGATISGHETAVQLQRREAKPDFAIAGEYWLQPMATGGYDHLFAVLVTTTLPWVHDDKYTASIEEAMANRRAATAEHAALLDHVRSRVAASWERLQATARIVELYQTSLIVQSEQSLQAARNAYEAGTAGFVTVVDNERTLLLNRLALARAEADYGRASADLYEAIGVVDAPALADTPPISLSSADTLLELAPPGIDLAGISPKLARVFPNGGGDMQEKRQ